LPWSSPEPVCSLLPQASSETSSRDNPAASKANCDIWGGWVHMLDPTRRELSPELSRACICRGTVDPSTAPGVPNGVRLG
jgi:hypothetical protein